MEYFGLWQHSLRQRRLSGRAEVNVKRRRIMIARFLIATCSLSHINSTHLADPKSKTIKFQANR
jgi:hypothetical protein